MFDDDGAIRDGAARFDGPSRQIVADGAVWVVRLWTNAYDRRKPDLVFFSDFVVRRVRNYPSDWHELADEALFTLSLER